MSKKKRKPAVGRCRYCNALLVKERAAVHMQECEERVKCRERLLEYMGETGACFDILAAAKKHPRYWGILEIDENCTLEDLHSYVDWMWMDEMCFIEESVISGTRYRLEPDMFYEEGEYSFEYTDIKLKKILEPGCRFKSLCCGERFRELELKVIGRNDRRSYIDRGAVIIAHNEYDMGTVIPKILHSDELIWDTLETEEGTEHLLNGISYLRVKDGHISISLGCLDDEITVSDEEIVGIVSRIKNDIENDFMIYGADFSPEFTRKLCRRYGFEIFRWDDDIPL